MLQPIDLATEDPIRAAERRAEMRLTKAWALVVGPALVKHTRLLRVRNRTLFMGCWKPEIIPNLRKSAEAVWPDIQARLQRLTRIKLQKIEVLPCDPPPEPAPIKPTLPADPLAAVLTKLRALRNQGWTPRKT